MSKSPGQNRIGSFLKGRQGFTLMELLVVVAIITILVGMISGTLVGAKSAGDGAQVKGDRGQAQTAVDAFNNNSTKAGQWPERAFGTTYLDPVGGARKFFDKDGAEIAGFSSSHTELDTNATAKVWQADGSVGSVALVPGFMLQVPSSFALENDEGLKDAFDAALPEFMWVMKINSKGSNSESRTVQVFRLNGTQQVDGTIALYEEFV